jgi:adenosylcobinamide kinase / adenosylcobinamide-phosphate guanylyltransferase
MPATVYLVTGGCRSGKSKYAESICTQLCPNPIYVATASHPKLMKNGTENDDNDDDDFAQRIERHQMDRASQTKNWTTIEEPLRPSRHANQFSGKAVLVDCLTVWLTNYMVEEGVFGDNNNNDDVEKMGTVNKEEEEEEEKTGKNNKGTTAFVEPSTSRITQQQQKQKQQQRQQTLACDRALTGLQQEFETLIRPYDVTFVFVTNEVGSATHSATHIARKFVDYQGWLNQFVAKYAQQVIHMVCGQPSLIKNELGVGGGPHQQVPSIITPPAILLAQRLDRHLSTRRMPMDSKGYFMISTDPIQCLIIASFHSCILNELGEVCDLEGNKIPCGSSSRPEPMKVWHCRTAKELTTEIFERWEFLDKAALSVGHAAYMGREAQRAEQCLYQSGIKYQQD